MAAILWLVAAVIAVVGVVQLFQGQLLLGVGLIVLAFAVGPGGWSIFNERSA